MKYTAIALLLLILWLPFGAHAQQTVRTLPPGAATEATIALVKSLLESATQSSTPVTALSLGSTSVAIASAASVLDGFYCHNPNGSTVYVQFFNSSAPTVGTTAPVLSFGIPAGQSPVAANMSIGFSTAIRVAATTTASGATGPSTPVVCSFWRRIN